MQLLESSFYNFSTKIHNKKMKKTMLVLMGMDALNGVMATDSPANLVVDGDFSQSDCY